MIQRFWLSRGRPPFGRCPNVALGLALLAASLPLTASRADLPPPLDAGTYRVYQKDKLIGTEDFYMLLTPDSMLVRTHASELLPRPGSAPDTLDKYAELLLGANDRSIRTYVSFEQINEKQLRRQLEMQDTTYTSSRSDELGGYADVFALPPGRIYVIDPQLFTLFDVVLRDVGEQGVDERGVMMLYLAGRDTSTEARVQHLGAEPVTIGTRQYAAQKYRITDPWSEFFAWTSTTGQMLKLTMPLVGLRVERDAKTLSPKGAPKLAGNEWVGPPPPPRLR